MIPRAFIDDLLARTDIVEVIDSYVPLRKAGKNYTACCPFHEEKTPSFNVQPEKQFYYCFGCHESGNVLSFLMNYNRLDFVEAVEELAGRYGLTVPRETAGSSREDKKSSGTQRESLYQVLNEAAGYYREQLQSHPEAGLARAYLERRGLSVETVTMFGLGFAPPGWRNLLQALGTIPARQSLLDQAGMLASNEQGRVYDRFRARVMFPIHDQRGRTIAFGGRVLDDSKPKYLNSPETPVFHKGRELYALDLVRKQRPPEIVVVEGYMDVVALAQYDIRNAVATLGTSLSNEHIKHLFRSVPRVVFCFDGDEAGRKAAWRALETSLPLLTEGREAAFVFLPAGEDPDTLVHSEGCVGFQERLAHATGAADFLFTDLRNKVDLNKLGGPGRLIELAAPLLNTMPPGPARNLLSERLRDVDTRNASRLLPSADELLARQVSQLARAVQRRAGTDTAQPSPLRSVLGLLLQHPQLAVEIAPATRDTLAALEIHGIDLLIALLDFIDAHGVEQVHTGLILENWRDTEHENELRKLAGWRHGLPESGIGEEFRGALQRLSGLYTDQRLEVLLAKSRLGALDELEKQEFKKLLMARH